MSAPTVRVVRDANIPSRITIFGARLAYAQGLNKPSALPPAPGQTPAAPKYNCAALVPDTATDALTVIQAVMKDVVDKEFGSAAPAVWQELAASGKLALKNGATKASQEGFMGTYFMSPNAREDRAPKLYNKFLNAEGTAPEELKRPQNVLYSGCYVNIQINIWAQNNVHGKRVNCELLAVQFAGDGDSFGGGASVDASAFGGEAAPSPFAGVPAPAAQAFTL